MRIGTRGLHIFVHIFNIATDIVRACFEHARQQHIDIENRRIPHFKIEHRIHGRLIHLHVKFHFHGKMVIAGIDLAVKRSTGAPRQVAIVHNFTETLGTI